MSQAAFDGITIDYDVIGDGEPLVLIMGLGTQRIFWPDELVKRFADNGFRVIRFDNRDVGGSTHLDGPGPTRRQLARAVIAPRSASAPYLLADMAADTLGLMGHLGVERAHVVGASMGGMIAQSVAIAAPHRVASLTSIMSNTGDHRHGLVSPRLIPKILPLLDRTPENAVDKGVAMWKAISGSQYEELELRALVEAAVARSDDRDGTARQTMAIAASPNRTKSLRRLTIPTLVMHGLDDQLVLPSGGFATARAVPGSRLMMFADMGHDLPPAYWDEMVGAITRNAQRSS